MPEAEVIRTRQIAAKFLQVDCGPRYWDDADVNGEEDVDGSRIPLREGGRWKPRIDLETGRVLDWPAGTCAKILYFVCDDGRYTLLDADGRRVAEIDGHVPDVMCPDGDGFGEFVNMTVREDGSIANWRAELAKFVPGRD